MKVTNKTLVLETLERIDFIQKLIDNLMEIMDFLSKGSRSKLDDQAHAPIYMALTNVELDQWRNLLMWGITLTEEEQERIKAATFQRFLNNKTSVIEWLNGGVKPSQWLTAEEDEFRVMARKAFAPKKRS